jgi:hypothetical protein
MFWGSISIYGPGCLIPLEGSMNSEKYINIIQSHLLPSATACFGNEPWILIQDNAPCHVSAASKKFFADKQISVLEWPSNSPDMNVIENIWCIFKKKLYSGGSGLTRNEVIRKATDIWENDDELRLVCHEMISNMPSRVKALYSNKGGSTKY